MAYWRLGALLAAVTVALLLVGCGSGTQEDIETPTATYLPLTVGNEWHYAVTDYSATAAQHSRSLRPHWLGRSGVSAAETSAEETVTISATTTIGGHIWYRTTLGWVGATTTEDRYLRHDRYGLLWKDLITSVGYYRLKAPVAVGTTWVDPSDTRYSYRITSVTDTVSTTAGDFTNCVSVVETFHETGSTDEVTTWWFADGVGVVQEVQYVGSDLVYESALKSYQLAASTAGQ